MTSRRGILGMLRASVRRAYTEGLAARARAASLRAASDGRVPFRVWLGLAGAGQTGLEAGTSPQTLPEGWSWNAYLRYQSVCGEVRDETRLHLASGLPAEQRVHELLGEVGRILARVGMSPQTIEGTITALLEDAEALRASENLTAVLRQLLRTGCHPDDVAGIERDLHVYAAQARAPT